MKNFTAAPRQYSGILLIAAMALLANSPGAVAQAVRLDWQLNPTGKPLEREAIITLRDLKGQPIRNGQIQITVDMPSMPMVHRVPPVNAEELPEAGKYRARLILEMPGVWAARLDVKSPHQSRITKRFRIE